MNVRCLAYRVLDAARKTWLFRYAFYAGTEMIIRPNARNVGTVIAVAHGESDGDVTFGIHVHRVDERGPFRHCEVTPCAAPSVRAVAQRLKVGDVVTIWGDERFDPAHVFDHGGPTGAPPHADGWWEFHPVDDLQILTEASDGGVSARVGAVGTAS